MSFEDGHGPAEFRPVKLGPRRRRFDPLVIGIGVVVVALVLAIVKPWDTLAPEVAAIPSVAPSLVTSAPADPSASPGEPIDPMALPTWSDVVPVVTRHPDWGIRTIVVGTTPATDGSSVAISERYAEHWSEAQDVGGGLSWSVVDGGPGPIVALGITFPPDEAPLDVRIWQRHANDELEWVDVLPVDDVPARGATLYVRRGAPGEGILEWEPGQYRADVLVGGGIKRIDLDVTTSFGDLPVAQPWVRDPAVPSGLDTSSLQLLRQGLFIHSADTTESVASTAGPKLDEYGSWLDVDRDVPTAGPRAFVAQVYGPGLAHIGVILPAFSTVHDTDVQRLAPSADPTDGIRQMAMGSAGSVSFVAFAPRDGSIWKPGVYALTVAWDDADGDHQETWHVEVRPGPVTHTPVLLAATRAWSRFVGSNGVLLGVPESLSGSDPLGVTLLPITPQDEPGYPGLSGSDLIGCGETLVQGRPEVIGIVGDPAAELTPVTSRILYPFPDAGPLEILTAAGAVPGLTLAAPVMTAELGGPASYGFRAGTTADAPGYTICIGFAAGG